MSFSFNLCFRVMIRSFLVSSAAEKVDVLNARGSKESLKPPAVLMVSGYII